jgi:hypothetical protein
VDNHGASLVSFKNEFRLHCTEIVSKRVAESLQISQQQLSLKSSATIS